MGIVKNLPKLERPREKANRYGIESLSDSELLSILLNNGYKGSSVIEISTSLLNKYGGLKNLSEQSISELKNNKGIKEAKSIILAAIFEIHKRLNIKAIEAQENNVDEKYLVKKYQQTLLRCNQEIFIIVVVNSRNKILHEKILYKGTENMLTISFEDIYQTLVSNNGKNYYLIHNHLKGDSSPSQYDIIATKNIILQSKKYGKQLLDHLIISERDYYSFKKNEKTDISC